MSAHTTLVPSRAKRIEIALPFPTPGPLEPAPTTSATLPSSLKTHSLQKLFYKFQPLIGASNSTILNQFRTLFKRFSPL
ncbi:MAG: hypothetical protein ACETWM_21760 [Candidatus Lokiarchaeia archaeon]